MLSGAATQARATVGEEAVEGKNRECALSLTYTLSLSLTHTLTYTHSHAHAHTGTDGGDRSGRGDERRVRLLLFGGGRPED